MKDQHQTSNEMDKDFKKFEEDIGITFNDPTLLATAFTHRSYVNESKSSLEHNERLEFLGDAVLELVVTDYLFRKYSDTPEGELTAYRAALVNTATLGNIAEEIGMNNFLLLSKGESKDTGRARASILANTFEAVIGAIYLDQGYEIVDSFIKGHVLTRAEQVVSSGSWKDAKSSFQETAQAKYGVTPRYDVIHSEGPDHDKHFVVGVFIGEKKIAEGEGKSKQEAEQKAAESALEANK